MLNLFVAAVQVGGDTLASVRVPVGYNVGARRIRNAFLESQRRAGTVTIGVPITAPVQTDPGISADPVRSLLWYLLGPLDTKIQL